MKQQADDRKKGKAARVIITLILIAAVLALLAVGGRWVFSWFRETVGNCANRVADVRGTVESWFSGVAEDLMNIEHTPGEQLEFRGNWGTVRELTEPIPASGDYTFKVSVTDIVQTDGEALENPADGMWAVCIRGMDGKWIILTKMEVIGGEGEIRIAHMPYGFEAFAIIYAGELSWTGNIEQTIERNTDTAEWEANIDIFDYYTTRSGDDLLLGTSLFSEGPVYLHNSRDVWVGVVCQREPKEDLETVFFTENLAETCMTHGVALVRDVNIPAGEECYNTAVEQVNRGCSIIFAYGEGYEDYIIRAAEENPDVQFFLVGGKKANSTGLANYHNAYPALHHAQYLAGVSAGMKLNEMISKGKLKEEDAKLGYVTLSLQAENISSYTAFFLGAKSVCPTVTMEVEFSGTYHDGAAERASAEKLVNKGCKIICHNMDASALEIAQVCHENGVYYIAFLSDGAVQYYPDITLGRIGPALIDFDYIIGDYLAGHESTFAPDGTTDFSNAVDTGWYELRDDSAEAAYTEEKLIEIKNGIYSGQVHVFDTANFTVDGQPVTSYKVDIDGDGIRETEAIVDGCFRESYFRSAPYFDLRIDGINVNA